MSETEPNAQALAELLAEWRATCEHGIDYEDDCTQCDAIAGLAKADGAVTPNEIEIWERGYDRARAHRAARLGIEEVIAAHGLAPDVTAIRWLGEGVCVCQMRFTGLHWPGVIEQHAAHVADALRAAGWAKP